MTFLAIMIAFGLSLLVGVVHSTPAYQLILKISNPNSSPINPTSSSDPISILNIAGIQIYGTDCRASGCIHEPDGAFGGLPPYNHNLSYSYYQAGPGTVNFSMSSYMSYKNDIIDNTGGLSGQNMDRNASYCLDDLDTTFCSTSFTGSCRFGAMPQSPNDNHC